MQDIAMAMDIMARYVDYPTFNYDQIEKMLDSEISTKEIPEESSDGERLTELGWQLNSGNHWTYYL